MNVLQLPGVHSNTCTCLLCAVASFTCLMRVTCASKAPLTTSFRLEKPVMYDQPSAIPSHVFDLSFSPCYYTVLYIRCDGHILYALPIKETRHEEFRAGSVASRINYA